MSARLYASDNELIMLLNKRDADAFAYVYNSYWPKLYLYALKIVKDGLDAEDVVQEVLLALWNKGESLSINGSVLSYLLGAVRYTCFNHIDKLNTRQKHLQSLYDFANTESHNTSDRIFERELNGIIEETVSKLPPRMREVFEMSRHQQLSQKEIAEKLNISDKTVKKQINKALKLIKTKLDYSFFAPSSTIILALAAHFLEALIFFIVFS